MSKPFFSVVMPTFNRSNKISQTIESVLNQTFRNYEFIIVDDGSTDQTEEVVSRYTLKDPRIKYIKTKNWGGPARPRNIGIKASKGSYVSFLDDDDIWYKNKLEVVNKYILGHPNAILFCHDEDFKVNNLKKRTYYNGPFSDNIYETLLFDRNNISPSASVVKKEIILEVGGFSEDRSFIYVDDYDLWIRLSTLGKFVHIPDVLGQYIVESDGDNISFNPVKYTEANLNVTKHHLNLWLKQHPEDIKKCKNRLSSVYSNLGLTLLRGRKFNFAKQFAIKAIKINKINCKSYLLFLLAFFRCPLRY